MSKQVSSAVFDLLDRARMELSEESLEEPLSADMSVLEFMTEFFQQFFDAQLDKEITAINSDSATSAGLLLKLQPDLPSEVKRLIRRFRVLCKIDPDIRGSDYGGESDAYREFYEEFVPEALTEIEEWATCLRRKDLTKRAGQARTDWLKALEDLAEPDDD